MSGLTVFELRQYTYKPGRREEFIELFEAKLLEPLEAAGMEVIGLFRDLDDPDRFVWLRGFPDMAARLAALETFYNSDLWLSYRDAVNATLVDSDDVLLLRPAAEPNWNVGAPGSVYSATVWPFAGDLPDGRDAVALLVTEPSPNDFPRLPVREGENVVVRLVRGDEDAAGLLDAEPLQAMRLEPTTRSRLA